MSVKYQLMKEQGSEPDDEDVEAMMKLARNMALEKCVTALSEDASIFRAFNGLSGFAAEFGWDAWRHQCKDVVSPKGPCIEAEARAAEEIRQSNQEKTSQNISFICEHLLERPALIDRISTRNRSWLECLKVGLKAKPTAQALQSCKFLSASAETRATDALVQCFRERAK